MHLSIIYHLFRKISESNVINDNRFYIEYLRIRMLYTNNLALNVYYYY